MLEAGTPQARRFLAEHGIDGPLPIVALAEGKVLAEGDMQSVQANPKVKEVYLGH